MDVVTKSLYDTDFVEWTAYASELLRQGRFDEIDLENLIEEIEDLGKSEQSAVLLQLTRMVMHLVKHTIQPQRSGASWRSSFVDARRQILHKLEISPSLRRHLQNALQMAYQEAVRDALDETGLAGSAKNLGIPAACPFSLTDLLEKDLSELTLRR
jgi:hypothetical protein